VRPSVVEPTRTSGAGGRSVNDAPARAGSRCRASPTGAPRGAPRESARRVGADAVRAVLDALQRRVDVGEDVLRVLLERVVELAVVRLGRRVGEVVVVRGLLAGSSESVPAWSSCRFSSAATTRLRSSRSSSRK
jgi:hypothetical protein